MSSRHWIAGRLAVLLSAVVLELGGQDDLILRRDGSAIRFQALEGVGHLMICAPNDCPTCYEFLIAEVGRLTNEPVWHGHWIFIVVSEVDSDMAFARWIRDRYNPPVPLYTAARRALGTLIPSGMPATPCIVRRKPDGTLTDPWTITPGALGAAARFFDSLYVSGPGGRGP